MELACFVKEFHCQKGTELFVLYFLIIPTHSTLKEEVAVATLLKYDQKHVWITLVVIDWHKFVVCDGVIFRDEGQQGRLYVCYELVAADISEESRGAFIAKDGPSHSAVELCQCLRLFALVFVEVWVLRSDPEQAFGEGVL